MARTKNNRRRGDSRRSGSTLGEMCPELKDAVSAEDRKKAEEMERLWKTQERFTRSIGHRGF